MSSEVKSLVQEQEIKHAEESLVTEEEQKYAHSLKDGIYKFLIDKWIERNGENTEDKIENSNLITTSSSFKLSDIKDKFQIIGIKHIENACNLLLSERKIVIPETIGGRSRIVIYNLNLHIAKDVATERRKVRYR